jgi:hypothetical protein
MKRPPMRLVGIKCRTPARQSQSDLVEPFGVAVSGTRIVAGVWGEDGPNNQGIAYVFDATTGALISTLTNPAPAAGDGFGWSVAISGTVAVIGAINDDPGGIGNAGTAYVFDATTGALIATQPQSRRRRPVRLAGRHIRHRCGGRCAAG